MKKFFKIIFQSLGLIEIARFTYSTLKLISFSSIINEIKFRVNGLPDGSPSPPSKLIFLIIGHGSVSDYYKSGQIITTDMLSNLRKNKINIYEFERILDFGCGCGRLIRHFASYKKELYGSDYNPVLIDWCNKNLTFAKFSINNLAPPLNYQSNFFNFIYARSVFTHLGEQLQIDWMKEINRILKPGGILYFTIHGENCINSLSGEEIKKFTIGETIVENIHIEGDNKCASFESKDFVEKKLLNGFTLVDFISGTENEHLKQDIYIVRKKS